MILAPFPSPFPSPLLSFPPYCLSRFFFFFFFFEPLPRRSGRVKIATSIHTFAFFHSSYFYYHILFCLFVLFVGGAMINALYFDTFLSLSFRIAFFSMYISIFFVIIALSSYSFFSYVDKH